MELLTSKDMYGIPIPLMIRNDSQLFQLRELYKGMEPDSWWMFVC